MFYVYIQNTYFFQIDELKKFNSSFLPVVDFHS